MSDEKEVLLQVLSRLPGDTDTPARADAPLTVAPAIRFAEQRFMTAMTVCQMARAAQMSRFHFTRVFRRETGLTPNGFLTRYRMARAMDMLRDTELGVGRVGQEVGYLNAAAFSRVFGKTVGVPPQVYRTLAHDDRIRALPPIRASMPPPKGQAEALFPLAHAAGV